MKIHMGARGEAADGSARNGAELVEIHLLGGAGYRREPHRNRLGVGSRAERHQCAGLFGRAKRLGGSYGLRELPGIDLLPGALLATDEVAAAGAPEYAGVGDARRRRRLVTQRPRR